MQPALPPLPAALFRTVLRLILIACVIWLAFRMMHWAEAQLSDTSLSWAAPALTLGLLVLYALLIALPFVPGVEIGLMLLAMSGAALAPAVWLATTLGLSLAFVAGARVPYAWLLRLLRDLHLTRACRLLEQFETLPQAERETFIQSFLPTRHLNWVVRYRYVNLAVLINIPGNAVIGGGGGIALISGLSHMFRTWLVILTIALATAPVPLAVWLFDWQVPGF